jgi:3-dehydroquinate dehydratase-2
VIARLSMGRRDEKDIVAGRAFIRPFPTDSDSLPNKAKKECDLVHDNNHDSDIHKHISPNITTTRFIMAKSILLINGPNLNLLGTREPATYGSTTLPEVVEAASEQCARQSITFSHIQSNHEGVLLDRIHEARGNVDAIIINPGAFTHTSVAIRDALLGVDIPFIEVHISNVHAREAFRHHSYLSDKAVAVICGLGTYGYEAAIEYAARHIKSK